MAFISDQIQEQKKSASSQSFAWHWHSKVEASGYQILLKITSLLVAAEATQDHLDAIENSLWVILLIDKS